MIPACLERNSLIMLHYERKQIDIPHSQLPLEAFLCSQLIMETTEFLKFVYNRFYFILFFLTVNKYQEEILVAND